ncbi:hypothetical protein [Thioclava sp.]
MLRTIQIGSSVFVQGVYERTLDCGHILVRVGDALFAGHPVNR